MPSSRCSQPTEVCFLRRNRFSNGNPEARASTTSNSSKRDSQIGELNPFDERFERMNNVMKTFKSSLSHYM